MLWRNTDILNKNNQFSKWFYLHFSYTGMLNDTFWLVSTPVWITWIKDTDVLHMMKCKTINPKLWSHPLNPHTASGLLPRHLKFKVSLWNLNKCIWLHFFGVSNNTGVLLAKFARQKKKKTFNSQTFTCMFPALHLLFLDLGYLSQLSSGYDFYVFNYGNLLTPSSTVQSDKDIVLYTQKR